MFLKFNIIFNNNYVPVIHIILILICKLSIVPNLSLNITNFLFFGLAAKQKKEKVSNI